jgi:hypothetical protein
MYVNNARLAECLCFARSDYITEKIPFHKKCNCVWRTNNFCRSTISLVNTFSMICRLNTIPRGRNIFFLSKTILVKNKVEDCVGGRSVDRFCDQSMNLWSRWYAGCRASWTKRWASCFSLGVGTDGHLVLAVPVRQLRQQGTRTLAQQRFHFGQPLHPGRGPLRLFGRGRFQQPVPSRERCVPTWRSFK